MADDKEKSVNVSVTRSSDGMGLLILAILTGYLLFDGNPCIAESLRIMAAKYAASMP
jgi:hypothetical protein